MIYDVVMFILIDISDTAFKIKINFTNPCREKSVNY